MIAVCVLVLVAALVLAIRWGDRPFVTPTYDGDELPAGWTVRLLFQRLVLLVAAVFLTGLPVAGAGGRLVMRLLAVTAGDDAQGLLTEAEQEVGVISVGGTIGLVTFSGALGGLLAGLTYLVLRRWLPSGRLGGLCLGVLLLVALAPTLEPLRRDNVDFDLVGPGWLALLAFSGLALAQGVTTAAVVNRLSGVVPLWDRTWRSTAMHLPLLLLLPIGAVVAGPMLIVVPVAVAAGRTSAVVTALRTDRALVVGRLVIAAVLLVCLPRFVATVVDIAGRG